MPEIAPEWQLSSGLRDDMVLSIYNTYFAPDAEYQGGRVLLLHLIGVDETEEPVTLKLSVGADWESSDGGSTITHPTKKQQKINGSTIYGHWIAHAQEIDELVKVLQQRPGGPLNSKVWEGLIIHLQERELKFGRNIEPQLRLMPTEYFGLVENGAQQELAPPPAPVGVPQVPVTTPSPPTDTEAIIAAARAKAAAAQSNGSSPLYAEVVLWAQTLDWPVFLDKVLTDPRVMADDDLLHQAVDQTILYNSARS